MLAVMRCFIFDALAARQQHAKLVARMCGFEVAQLGGERARYLDERKSPAARLTQAQVESPVVLLINQRVRCVTERMSKRSIGPFGLVENRIEEGAVVVGPLERVVGVVDPIGQELAR